MNSAHIFTDCWRTLTAPSAVKQMESHKAGNVREKINVEPGGEESCSKIPDFLNQIQY